MGKPTVEDLADSTVKAGVRAAKEYLATYTTQVLTPQEEQLVTIGILAGVKAMAGELTGRGAIKEGAWD